MGSLDNVTGTLYVKYNNETGQTWTEVGKVVSEREDILLNGRRIIIID